MLTINQIKALKPQDKDYRVTDGKGLYLLVKTNGSKLWRYDYSRPITKKRATYAIGIYPDISLSDAREKHQELRSLIAKGIDPYEHKREVAQQELLSKKTVFEAVCEEYLERKAVTLTAGTLRNNHRYLSYACAKFGKKPISEIKAVDVLDVCRAYEKKGLYETAIKIRSIVGQVMRYGVISGYCERDVTQDLRGAIIVPQTKHLAAMLDPDDIGKLLSAFEDYSGYLETKIALKLIAYIFVRQGELRYAKWSDIDFEKRQFKFTPRKTKNITGIDVVVPLSNQAFDLLQELELLTRHRSEYLFPAVHTTKQPMSENTMGQALKRLGYTGEEQTIHGFRAIARTLLVEQLGYDEKLIEMQLGHRVRDMHGRAYNRVQWLDDRREMMQTWADYLDKLKNG